ncbi:MAG: ABC transporter permease [Tissierellia bacterium]|nr:ABC transporter permease [Tissierellia bacterium]
MIKVQNKKAIRNLTIKYMKENKRRNIIIIVTIILTTFLFTSVFSVASILKTSIENQAFRQVGGSFHGAFKDVSEELAEKLRVDPLIVNSGLRKVLGMGKNPEFSKAQVEVSFMDEEAAKYSFLMPEVGRLPKENTKEIACDTRVLEMLGKDLKLGQEIELEIILGNRKIIKDKFILVGYWEYDDAMYANQILIPKSYVDESLIGYERFEYDVTGQVTLNVFFKNANNIEEDLKTVAENHGYQIQDESKENYLKTGINWGYLGSQANANNPIEMQITIGILVILIGISRYMIIYNIFQISVLQDIQFYGLLKTIGTTRRQIKKIIYLQGLSLAAIGIPFGLVLGGIFGKAISYKFTAIIQDHVIDGKISPIALAISVLFSLLVVIISARKPGNIAGKVSPVEAVKFSGLDISGKKKKVSNENFSIFNFALENLKRNIKKTIMVGLSISMAVILFQGTINLTNGFDMEKYLSHWVISDFIVGKYNYFRSPTIVESDLFRSLNDEEVEFLESSIDSENSGKVYVSLNSGIALTKNEMKNTESITDDENMENYIKVGGDKYLNSVQIYGLNKFMQGKLELIDGDLEKLNTIDNAIVAIYRLDDYSNPKMSSNIKNVGDKVTIRHFRDYKLIDYETNTEVEELEGMDTSTINPIGEDEYFEEYTVVATAAISHPMTYRYYGPLQFALSEEKLLENPKSAKVLAMHFDVEDSKSEEVESFLENYTRKINKGLDFESKNSYLSNFNDLKMLVSLAGISFSGILALIGALNYLNTIITTMLARKREFAILQAIGMTNKQLEKMIQIEGICYVGISGVIAIAAIILINTFIWPALEKNLWFFTAKNSYTQGILLLGIYIIIGMTISKIGFRNLNKESVVNRIGAV